MSIFNRSKNDKTESDKSSSEELKTVSTPSDSVSDDDSRQSSEDTSKTEDKKTEVVSKRKITKMDNARIAFKDMFGKDGIARKDIMLEFQSDRVKLTKAGAGTYYAKLKREHFEQFGTGLELTENQIAGAIKRMARNKPKAMEWIDRSFLSNEMKTAYHEVLEKRYAQIGLIQ